MRILIVDASRAMRRVLIAILAHLGHADVIETTNGPDALKHLDANSIGQVIAASAATSAVQVPGRSARSIAADCHGRGRAVHRPELPGR